MVRSLAQVALELLLETARGLMAGAQAREAGVLARDHLPPLLLAG